MPNKGNQISAGKVWGNDAPIVPVEHDANRAGTSDGFNDRDFNLARVIKELAEGKTPSGRSGELLAEHSRSASRARHGGIMLPEALVLGTRASDSTTENSRDLIGEDHLAEEFISLLRNAPVIKRAGARSMVLGRGSGDVSVPKQASPLTAEWVAEDAAPASSVMTFSSEVASPKTIAAYNDSSRRIRIQSDPSINALLQQDLRDTLNVAIDKAAFGTNTVNGPNGLQSVAEEIVVDSSDKLWGSLVDAQTFIESNNSEVSAVCMSPVARAVLLKTPKVPGEADFCIDANSNTLLGRPVYVSNSVPQDLIFVGRYSDFVLITWSDLELLVDPYSLSTSGAVRTTIFQDLDFVVRHAESFAMVNVGALIS